MSQHDYSVPMPDPVRALDRDRLERLRKQEGYIGGPLSAEDEEQIRLLAMAGEGGTY